MTLESQALKKLRVALLKACQISILFLNVSFLALKSPKMLGQTGILALVLVPFTIAQISEGFEKGWDQTVWTTYAPDCSQGGKVALDSTTANTGKNSIRVDGAGGYCGHIFVGTNKVPAGDVYVRTYL
jgi:hypothetical protein